MSIAPIVVLNIHLKPPRPRPVNGVIAATQDIPATNPEPETEPVW